MEVHTTGHKCRPYQVIGNVETGLLKWFVLWTPQMHCFWVAAVQNNVFVMLRVLNLISDRRSSKICMCTVAFFKVLFIVLTSSQKTAWEDL